MLNIDYEYRNITIRVKYYKDGIEPNPSLVCDFCGKPLQREIGKKKIHYQLCLKCRELFNKKLLSGMSVLDQSKFSILNQSTENRGF